MPKIKRLFWDIETSPDVTYSWRVGHKLSLGAENIITERCVICICWKWEGEKAVHSLTWDDVKNDRDMLRGFLRVAAEADELVAHNGDRFDLPWFRTRCLYHGLTPLPIYKTVDTLAWARRLFYFNSNRLDYIGRFLGLGAKLHTGFDLWKKVMDGDTTALSYMVKYCKQDVRLLEQVYQRLSTVAPAKTHAGVLFGGDTWQCPRCASEAVHKNKTRVTAGGTIRHQMACNKCGGSFTINEAAFGRYLKVKKTETGTPVPVEA